MSTERCCPKAQIALLTGDRSCQAGMPGPSRGPSTPVTLAPVWPTVDDEQNRSWAAPAKRITSQEELSRCAAVNSLLHRLRLCTHDGSVQVPAFLSCQELCGICAVCQRRCEGPADICRPASLSGSGGPDSSRGEPGGSARTDPTSSARHALRQPSLQVLALLLLLLPHRCSCRGLSSDPTCCLDAGHGLHP